MSSLVENSQVTSVADASAPTILLERPDPAMVEIIIDLMARYKKVAADGWTSATKLEDLQIDSFDFVEFVFLIEDELDIEIKYNANDTARRLSTIGDIAREVGRQVKAKAAA